MIGNIPAIFVSSTCYDLRQARADLKSFIETLGFEAILSDFNSFPVAPELDVVDNCLGIVDSKADIFVLVVGGRYGSLHDQGKSVTNMEFVHARAKGIPVYAFVSESVLHVLPVWRTNPNADFSSVSDSPKLFEFVDFLLQMSGVWVFHFDRVNDIVETLRKQLAYLIKDALQFRTKAMAEELTPSLRHLNGLALRLVIEKPRFWERRLFSEVLTQQLDRHKKLKLDLTHNTALRKRELALGDSIHNWLSAKLTDVPHLLLVAERLVEKTYPEAMGEDGPGDPERIVLVAEKIGDLYAASMEWSMDFQGISVDPEFTPAVEVLSNFLSPLTTAIEEFCREIKLSSDRLVANPPAIGESDDEVVTLKVHLDSADFDAELERLGLKVILPGR